ncbi:hypothetical protein [Nostoc sp. UIC 10630]|uniref:hypothetical protein n=1 Tax=Nostoc sp. UIC 10630 TaxID=2100146 RepID=UPI0013D4D947|nr:hypothetical protein [Nostoc sp. UIC 10630]NEU82968.1 hypothetical protein [Nostoc sp. UIC 10630]
MVNKIVTTFEQDHNRPESKEFYWKHFLYSLVWLTVLMLGYGGLGWTLWLDHHFSTIAIPMFILAIAAVRACILTGFPVWAGLLSLTFGFTWILTGASISSGLLGWAIAITLSWIGIFPLDMALDQSVENLLEIELSRTEVFLILTAVCATGAIAGWILPIFLT